MLFIHVHFVEIAAGRQKKPLSPISLLPVPQIWLKYARCCAAGNRRMPSGTSKISFLWSLLLKKRGEIKGLQLSRGWTRNQQSFLGFTWNILHQASYFVLNFFLTTWEVISWYNRQDFRENHPFTDIEFTARPFRDTTDNNRHTWLTVIFLNWKKYKILRTDNIKPKERLSEYFYFTYLTSEESSLTNNNNKLRYFTALPSFAVLNDKSFQMFEPIYQYREQIITLSAIL